MTYTPEQIAAAIGFTHNEERKFFRDSIDFDVYAAAKRRAGEFKQFAVSGDWRDGGQCTKEYAAIEVDPDTLCMVYPALAGTANAGRLIADVVRVGDYFWKPL